MNLYLPVKSDEITKKRGDRLMSGSLWYQEAVMRVWTRWEQIPIFHS